MGIINFLLKNPVLAVLSLVALMSKDDKKQGIIGSPDNIYAVLILDAKDAKTAPTLRKLFIERKTELPVTNDISNDFKKSLDAIWIGKRSKLIKIGLDKAFSIPENANGDIVIILLRAIQDIPIIDKGIDELGTEQYKMLNANKDLVFDKLPDAFSIAGISNKITMKEMSSSLDESFNIFIVRP